jgi:hypothetical protein
LGGLAAGHSLIPSRVGWDLAKVSCEYAEQLIPRHSPDVLNAHYARMFEKEYPDFARAHGPQDPDHFWLVRSFEYFRREPRRSVKLKLRNVFYLFGPRIVPFYPWRPELRVLFLPDGRLEVLNAKPRSRLAEWAHGLSWSLIFTAALAGIWLRRHSWKKEFFLYCIVAVYALVYTVFWPPTRHRVSADFIFIFYASYALVRILDNRGRYAKLKLALNRIEC